MFLQKQYILSIILSIVSISSHSQEKDSSFTAAKKIQFSYADMATSIGIMQNDYNSIRLSSSYNIQNRNKASIGLKLEGGWGEYSYLGLGPTIKYRFFNDKSTPFLEADVLVLKNRLMKHSDYYERENSYYYYWGGRGIIFLGFSHKFQNSNLTLDVKYGMGYQTFKMLDYRTYSLKPQLKRSSELGCIKYLSLGLSYYFNSSK